MPRSYGHSTKIDIERTRRIVMILMETQGHVPHKVIAYRCGCTKTHVGRVKERYLREEKMLVLNHDGIVLINGNQLLLPLPVKRIPPNLGKKWTPEKRARAKITRSLGRSYGV